VIVVVDYGVNNLRSVVRALAAGGHEATLTAEPAAVRRADRLVVPGVGNFGQASRNLADSGLGDAIREVALAGRPVLGICLGLQLLFPDSEEAPGAAGLGLLRGTVRRFRTALKVPHVGWARVDLTAAGTAHGVLGPLFHGEPLFFYHVHSFHPADLAADAILATADYDGPFPTLVGQANVLGAQFHPEKSQRAGIDLLAGFARWQP
jgi:imidazole glycerol-phosphate synthase subunit HisH